MTSRSDKRVSPPAVDVVRVLLIDDEADSLLPTLAQTLEPMGFEFNKESSAARALQAVQALNPDVILLDLHFPGDDRDGLRTTGGKLLTEIRRRFDAIPVVVFTTRLDDIDIPLESFDEQPHGYFAKPDFGRGRTWADALAGAIRSAINTARFSRNPDSGEFGFLVGQTKEMREVAGRIKTAAGNALTVLIYGETGTGKQRAAESIHKLSGRSGRFEQFNCAGVHEETLYATLFGHERGAYTGAQAAKPGLFELADGGTLFLDEVQRMPMSLQDQLMLVVEAGRVRRMGASSDKEVDVRLIVATNHSLSDLVADGVLREDLAFRLSEFPISLPSLKQRMADIPELFKIFVSKANTSIGRDVSEVLRPEVRAKLEAHTWEGNIRELESTIARAVANTRSSVLLPQDIECVSIPRRKPIDSSAVSPQPADASLPATVPAFGASKEAFAKALANELESLPLAKRYAFLLQYGEDLQRLILTDFICRLRQQKGRRVQHKELAAALDPLPNGDKDFAKIRQFVCGLVSLSKLDCNQ